MKRTNTKIGGVLVLLLFPLILQAQRFRPPMDHEITFSGNYGEIRADHYHGGLEYVGEPTQRQKRKKTASTGQKSDKNGL